MLHVVLTWIQFQLQLSLSLVLTFVEPVTCDTAVNLVFESKVTEVTVLKSFSSCDSLCHDAHEDPAERSEEPWILFSEKHLIMC